MLVHMRELHRVRGLVHCGVLCTQDRAPRKDSLKEDWMVAAFTWHLAVTFSGPPSGEGVCREAHVCKCRVEQGWRSRGV